MAYSCYDNIFLILSVTHPELQHQYQAFAHLLQVNSLPANAGETRDTGLIPWLGRSPGRGNGNPPQYSFGASLITQMV